MLFFPDRNIGSTPLSIGLSFEEVSILTRDKVKIHGWFLPVAGAEKILLFFHGNAGNISHRLESLEIFTRMGLSVFIIDYRGYGKSEGKPSEQGTYLDAEAAWNYLTTDRNYDPNEIIVFGRSMGGSLGTYVAGKFNPAALILESSFTSVPELAGDIYWYFPVKLLSRINYDNLGRIQDIKCPVLIIHSKDDEIIPFRHGQKLFEIANNPKEFLEINFGHNDGFYLSGEKYTDGIIKFLGDHLN